MHYHEIIIANLTVPITTLIYERVTFPESRSARVLNDIVADGPPKSFMIPIILIVAPSWLPKRSLLFFLFSLNFRPGGTVIRARSGRDFDQILASPIEI